MRSKLLLALQLIICTQSEHVTVLANLPATSHYNLYHTNDQHGCLYLFLMDDHITGYESDYEYDIKISGGFHIIPYCVHPIEEIKRDVFDSNECIDNNICWTFGQLKEKQITSKDLLVWSTPIDLVEHYQTFLNNPNASNSLSLVLIYNCSEGWFGARCQYTWDFDGLTFTEIVRDTFEAKYYYPRQAKSSNGTCYTHLLCDRGPNSSCLDWREICNGKRDCINGDIDEPRYCIELEASECARGEYRCRNGQCIPAVFFRDRDYDCADITDEIVEAGGITELDEDGDRCVKDPSFDCEERICPKRYDFPCGDGECMPRMMPLSVDVNVCANHRNQKLTHALLSHMGNSHLSSECFSVMHRITRMNYLISKGSSGRICRNISQCTDLLQAIKCPSPFFFFPAYPVVHGHVRFVYTTNVTDFAGDTLYTPYLICFDSQLCDPLINRTVSYNRLTCHYYADLSLSNKMFEKWTNLIDDTHDLFLRCSSIATENCINLFRCKQSDLCISKHRLLDGVNDCFDNSDENSNDTCFLNDPYRFQCSSDRNLCISIVLIKDGIPHCLSGEDEQKPLQLQLFPILCDWYQDIFPIFENGREQTDETDCGPYFPCNNQYTQCDGVWNCPNGIDEADCPSSMCPRFHHPCMSLVNNSVECLPLALANDGIIHCRGGSDERHYCRDLFPESDYIRYRCFNKTQNCIPAHILCINDKDMSIKDEQRCREDEDFICPPLYFQNQLAFSGICSAQWNEQRSKAEELLCNLKDEFPQNTYGKRPKRYLTLRHAGYYPFRTVKNALQSSQNIIYDEHISTPIRRNKMTILSRIWLCNRGIHVFIGEKKGNACFCPPAYYGDLCQYQNQRVSLILQFVKKLSFDRDIVFYTVIMLIDQQQTVESYDYIIYVPVRDCNIKFRSNLLYSSRPKDPNKTYSVRIDAFNNNNLVYLSSWHLLIRFQDLPVNHLVAYLSIGTQEIARDGKYCTLDCGNHGQCVKYANMASYFCRCMPGWFGYFCNISHECQCSADSICVGVIANRSICICPLHKFGTFCQLTRSLCQENTCNYRGICVPDDQRMPVPDLTCVCSEGYFGSRCEFFNSKIQISFDDMPIPQAIFAHFIGAMQNAPHLRTTAFKKIPYDQDTVTLFRSSSFHIVLTEFSSNYYMAVVQEKFSTSITISTRVLRSNRCQHISFLFNNTILNYNHLHRMKYYHIACKEHSQLVCFYDEALMCLCNLDRQANCFEFDHNMSYICQDGDYCKNGAECFQDHPSCPLTSICVCADCYFGSQCQFTTKTFDLSLETVLGYQVHSDVSFSGQPTSLKICLVVAISMLIIGLISGSLSIITFKSKKLREVGCGNYLFASSIVCLLHIIMFGFKFLLLILSQMKLINNSYFLILTCKSMDFLLKVLPNTRDWLHAFVSIERLLTISKGIHFNKTRSSRISKAVILIVILIVICTNIHDPIYRRLIDDTGEKRTWCVADYPKSLQVFSSSVDILHFFIPFFINTISAFGFIITAARKRSTARKNQTYKQHLLGQFRQHKHLIISPFILTLFAVPRLIISFLSGCMRSARNPWSFTISYFTSLTSSISLFLVFVLPSEVYTASFLRSVQN